MELGWLLHMQFLMNLVRKRYFSLPLLSNKKEERAVPVTIDCAILNRMHKHNMLTKAENDFMFQSGNKGDVCIR